MVFRAFSPYRRALARAATLALIPYLLQHAARWGLVKRQRRRPRDIQHTEQ
jgi:hypothetical protein